MKINWQTKKLGEVCDFYNGLWKSKKPSYIEVGVIRNTNFTKDGSLDYSDIAYLDVEKRQFENRKLIYGDIILEKSGGGPKQPVGRVVIFDKKDGEFSFSNFTSAIRVKNSMELDFNFLHKFLFFSYISGITEKMQSHSTGIRNLDSKLYKNIEIPLPPLLEQHHIVKILDAVFADVAKAKENAEKNLQNAKELFESYLQSVFANPGEDWEEKTLEQVSITFGRGKSKHRPRNDKKLYNGKYPFIQTGDIRNCNHFIEKYTQTYNEIGLAQSKLWPKGTICITIAANIAETGILNFDACFPDSVIGIVVNPKITELNFVEYLLQSFKVQIQAKGKGSAQKNINMATFENELFPFPPLSEQKSIVAKLDALSTETKKLEANYKQKLADLEELKKSVLRKSFSGEL